jgi:hypothetical protein
MLGLGNRGRSLGGTTTKRYEDHRLIQEPAGQGSRTHFRHPAGVRGVLAPAVVVAELDLLAQNFLARGHGLDPSAEPADLADLDTSSSARRLAYFTRSRSALAVSRSAPVGSSLTWPRSWPSSRMGILEAERVTGVSKTAAVPVRGAVVWWVDELRGVPLPPRSER